MLLRNYILRASWEAGMGRAGYFPQEAQVICTEILRMFYQSVIASVLQCVWSGMSDLIKV